jgi:hypothetical protein
MSKSVKSSNIANLFYHLSKLVISKFHDSKNLNEQNFQKKTVLIKKFHSVFIDHHLNSRLKKLLSQ